MVEKFSKNRRKSEERVKKCQRVRKSQNFRFLAFSSTPKSKILVGKKFFSKKIFDFGVEITAKNRFFFDFRTLRVKNTLSSDFWRKKKFGQNRKFFDQNFFHPMDGSKMSKIEKFFFSPKIRKRGQKVPNFPKIAKFSIFGFFLAQNRKKILVKKCTFFSTF